MSEKKNLKNQDSILVSRMFKNALMIQIISAITGVIGTVVDGAVIGSLLPANSMTAYGLVTPVTSIFAAVSGIIGVGTSNLTGTLIGKGKLKETEEAIKSSAVFGLIISAVVSLVIFFGAGPIAGLFGAEGEIKALAADYLRGFAFCLPFMVLTTLLMPVMQFDNDASRVIVSVLAMTAVNIALDFMTAFVFKNGMFGMALATTISYVAALTILCLHFAKKNAGIHIAKSKTAFKDIPKVLLYGSPNGVRLISRTVFVAVLNMLLLRISGDSGVAIFAMINSGGALFLTVSQGISSTTQMLTSVISGEEDVTSLGILMKTGQRFAIAINAVTAAVLFIVAKPFVGLFFKGDPAVTGQAVSALRMYGLYLIPYTCCMVFTSYLQGMKNYKVAYPITVCSQMVFIPLSVLALNAAFGEGAIWLGFMCGGLLTLLMILISAIISGKGKKLSARSFLFIPEGFGVEDDMRLDASVTSAAQVAELSEKTMEFCRRVSGDEKSSFWISLFIEELAGNVIEHGFDPKKKNSVDVRIAYKDDGWMLRIKDNCPEFDPTHYWELFSDPDPCAHVGILLVAKKASEMKYLRSLRMNNLIVKL